MLVGLAIVPAMVAERPASNGYVRAAGRNLPTGFAGRNERKTRASVPEWVCFASAQSPTTPSLTSRPGELARSVLDVSRARRELGWQASASLSQGIGTVYRWIEAGASDRAPS